MTTKGKYIYLRDLIHKIKSKLTLYFEICQLSRLQKKALRKAKEKKQLNCIFLVLEPSTWKYDQVYSLMVKNKRFNPIIFVCPVVDYGENAKAEIMDSCFLYFSKKNYRVIRSWDKESNEYLNLRSLKPDILFYTNPYEGRIDNRYYITKYLDCLTVYVPYFINSSIVKGFSTNMPLHNLVWRKYAETYYEFKLSLNEQIRHGKNVVYTGYPGIEPFIDKNYKPVCCPWKVSDIRLKKIIWAPHHTIEKGAYGHSCFLEYCDFMLNMVKKYEGLAQFVFKPHPILRQKLDLLWGVDKTDSYFNEWKTAPNSTICETDYIDLFLTSDAMIHDSGSFVVEFLYVNKPVMRTINDLPLSEQFNQFGLDCLKQYYLSYSQDDVEHFIRNVIDGVDPLKEQRTRFIKECLLPKGSPSRNIINDILDSIDNQILYRN